MLVNHADAGSHGVAGAFEGLNFVVEQNLPLISLIQAIEHVHKRRFASAIFTKQAVDFA